MKNYNEELMDEIELIYTPHTKQLLIKYVMTEYEQEGDTSDETLKMELLWLYQNNLLSELILCEFIYSDKRLDPSKNPAIYAI